MVGRRISYQIHLSLNRFKYHQNFKSYTSCFPYELNPIRKNKNMNENNFQNRGNMYAVRTSERLFQDGIIVQGNHDNMYWGKQRASFFFCWKNIWYWKFCVRLPSARKRHGPQLANRTIGQSQVAKGELESQREAENTKSFWGQQQNGGGGQGEAGTREGLSAENGFKLGCSSCWLVQNKQAINLAVNNLKCVFPSTTHRLWCSGRLAAGGWRLFYAQKPSVTHSRIPYIYIYTLLQLCNNFIEQQRR